MNDQERHCLKIYLDSEAHQVAHKFGRKQDSQEKAKKVYLNSLAVYAVSLFLEEISFETNLNQGESWNPFAIAFHDVADLVIPNLGKLECRPVLPGETVINLPPEARENRIGYVAVQFHEQLSEAQLLGFCRALNPENPLQQIHISELEPIENLIDYLYHLELINNFLESEDPVALRVKERLENQSLLVIIVCFERMIRDFKKDGQSHIGSKILTEFTSRKEEISEPKYSIRGEVSELQRLQLEDLDIAKALLDKLQTILLPTWIKVTDKTKRLAETIQFVLDTNINQESILEPIPILAPELRTVTEGSRRKEWLYKDEETKSTIELIGVKLPSQDISLQCIVKSQLPEIGDSSKIRFELFEGVNEPNEDALFIEGQLSDYQEEPMILSQGEWLLLLQSLSDSDNDPYTWLFPFKI